MNRIKLYRFERFNKQETPPEKLSIKPFLPLYPAYGENDETERVCACTSVTDCIFAMADTLNELCNYKLGLYEANVPVNKVVQPTDNDVPDTWMTGEFWILNECEFTLTGTYTVSKHMSIPNSCYSRYMFLEDKAEPSDTPDRVIAPAIYGNKKCFSFLAFDDTRTNLNVTLDDCYKELNTIQ